MIPASFPSSAMANLHAIAVVEQYLDYLAFGISNLIDLLEPDAMVIGGGICAQGDKLLVPLRERARRMVYHPLFADRCKFAIAERFPGASPWPPGSGGSGRWQRRRPQSSPGGRRCRGGR